MVKFLLSFILLGFMSLGVLEAQQKQLPTKADTEEVYRKKMLEVKGCEELNQQLSKMFGDKYTLRDPKVIAQLKKNIANKSASRCIRKKSLYGIYGEDYVNQLHLINDKDNN